MTKHKFPFRLILSIVAGIVTAFSFSLMTHLILYVFGIFPPLFKPMFETKYVIAALAYHSLFAIAGAFVTAMIAKEQARKAIFILGAKEAVMWLIGILLLWHHVPSWANITKAILGPPLAWVGGKLYQQYKAKKDPKNVPKM
jgi:hypothetical protein